MNDKKFAYLINKLSEACKFVGGISKDNTCIVKDKKVSIYVPVIHEKLFEKPIVVRVEFPDRSMIDMDIKDIEKEEITYEDAEGRLFVENRIVLKTKKSGEIKINDKGEVIATC